MQSNINIFENPKSMHIELIDQIETQFHNIYDLHLEFIDWAWKNFQINFNIELVSFIAGIEDRQTKLENRAREATQEFGLLTPPEGIFYLIRDDKEAVGMGGIKKLERNIVEIKRMYVKPTHRGRGLGKKLLEKLIDDAKNFGYSSIRLDSMKFMEAAHGLYKSLGFLEREVYPNRLPKALRQYYIFMELQL